MITEKWEVHFNKQKGIYEVYPAVEGGNPRICAITNQRNEESIARLIAAAPKLLAACKSMALILLAIEASRGLTVDERKRLIVAEQAIAAAEKN